MCLPAVVRAGKRQKTVADRKEVLVSAQRIKDGGVHGTKHLGGVVCGVVERNLPAAVLQPAEQKRGVDLRLPAAVVKERSGSVGGRRKMT